MENMPSYVISRKVVKKGYTLDHKFCANCGKEITKFSFKTGKLYQAQHFICKTDSGMNVLICWNRYNCNLRKEERDGNR